MNKEKQRMYEQNLKRKWDNEAAFAFSMEKGKIESSRQIALKCMAEGLDHELIAKCTGLSIEEIERLTVISSLV